MRILVLYILLSSIIVLNNCGGKEQSASVVDTDMPVLWENLPQIKSASFDGPDRAWLITIKGKLLHTKDGGYNWSNQSQPPIGKLEVVSFIDSLRGWAVNESGQVWHSGDGGQSWEAIGNVVSGDERLYLPEQLIFLDELHGWIIDSFSVWCTGDGGTTWKRCLTSKNTTPANNCQPINGVFISLAMGWVTCTDGIVYRTSDGGNSWHSQVVDSTRTSFWSVHFINTHTGWVNGWPDGGIYRTDDGGRIWHKQLNTDEEIYINSVYFMNGDDGWAVGWKGSDNPNEDKRTGVILHTTNGGGKWQPVEVGGDAPFFSRIYFSDMQHGWLFARDDVYRSEDGGKTWRISLRLPPSK
jgi:photosystem II stability/assembly factor-like uncharacterized protein